MKFKVIAENGAEKELEIGNSTLKELRLFLEENQKQEDVFDIKRDDVYYSIDALGDTNPMYCGITKPAKGLVNVANACKDKELMEKRALNETLNRLMWRFSMQNGGREINWKTDCESKYYVYYNIFTNIFEPYGVTYDCGCRSANIIYFKTKETAERCIEEVIKPFLAEHPDFEPNVY